MLQERLWLEVDRVASRCRRLRWWRLAAMFWLIAAALAVAVWGVASASGWAVTTPIVTWITVALSGVLFGWLALSTWIDTSWVARQIESLFPDLNSCLLAALEQRPDSADGRLGFLQENVVRQALNHAATHDWRQVVPVRRIMRAIAVQFVALGLFVLTVIGVGQWSPAMSQLAQLESKSVDAISLGTKFTVDVEPGDTEVERGTSLLVLARVTGELPPDATLIMQPDGFRRQSRQRLGATGDNNPISGEIGDEGDAATKLTMSRSLEDPVFGGRIAAVTQPFAYHIELGGQVTKTFRVTVFEYPRLERADARLVYPSYTGLDERLVQDVRTVSVVEGTQVTIICHLNKRVRSSRFVETKRVAPKSKVESPTVAELVRVQGLGPTKSLNSHEFSYELTLTADRSQRLKLELIDDAGRRNIEAFEFSLNVLPNKPPTLKLVQPARDLEVSPLEELDVKATAWDDFGLKRLGLTFAITGQPATDVVLSENAAAREKHELANAIKFEELKAEPDQLLSYHFWAEDFGPDGNVRRTASDMFFAEVRHFEEIFRQGQPPPGGQQQQQGENAQTAQQLAQSQKDIINATWKVIRREVGPKLSGPFADDVGQISQSQQALLEKSEGMKEKLRDAQSLEHLEVVLSAMQQAIERLTTAHDGPTAEPLAPALAAEQAAYQALLKLRAREHEIIKQQQQSSSSSSSASARSQQQRQQMDQLDLKENENRYESERQAQQKQESEADRETRQVLNRLRELAQRQHDLNERLKDLQSALQEAATPDRREEIRQQLKRLQDEQRQMLRDTDELQSRMESATNQEQMSEERQKVEQTREDVRRAAEALEEEKVTQATAAGRRAEQQFDELRDEFRRRASNRFSEEVREMRESARELDREQKELSQQLAEVTQPEGQNSTNREPKRDSDKAGSTQSDSKQPAKPKSTNPKSLREDHRAEEIVRGLNEQKEKLSSLTERMKQTVQEAEQTEPLLSERLYDAARNVQSQSVDQALEAAGRSLQRGLNEDARQVERIAGQGITKLREGVEKAAEAVLGDETESLRRAREELRRLSQELNREIAHNAPQLAPNSEPSRDPNQPTQPNSEAESEQPTAPNGQQTPDGKSNRPRSQGPKSEPNSPQGAPRQPQSSERQTESGQTPGQQRPSQQQGQQSQSQQSAQQPGQQSGQQKGQQRGQQSAQPGQGQSQPSDTKSDDAQPVQSPGQSSSNQSDQQPSGQPGQQPSGQQSSGRNGQRGQQRSSGPSDSASSGTFDNPGSEQSSAPITGEDFVKWLDRLRDVEEMVGDPALRAEAARIRDQARAARAEFKRHSKEPNWQLIRANVAKPLAELTNRVADELLRRNSQKAIVPLDRDPVSPKFSEKTRRYYERLGSGK